jgi:hypothetical protein
MSQPLPPSQPSLAASPADATPSAVKRRRWVRWLLAFFVLLALLVFFLPNIVALPFCRQRLLDLAFSRLNTQATVSDLSLSWFSPVVMDDLKVQPENTDRAALIVPRLEGNASLVHLLFGHDLGGFRISQPELFVHFDSEETNVSRLLRGMGSLSFGHRSAQLDIVDGKLLLQGQSSPQPWQINNVNLSLALTPAAENSTGVPVIHGEHARLLQEMELTPEMCNDLLKFITPPLFQATRTSGKVSLELDEFNWPLGKPDAAELKGRLTLHEVNVIPGPIMQLLSNLLQNQSTTWIVQIARDDEVAFNMHDGRVYHENLTLRLSALPAEVMLHSHGSVGLDETLDWFLEFQFPGLENADLTGRPLLKLLSAKPTVHVVGTLSQPKLGPEGLTAQVLKAGFEWLMQRRAQQQNVPSQPDLPPSR